MLIGSSLSEYEENGVNEGGLAQYERNKSQNPSKTPSYGGKFKKIHISTKTQRIIITTEKYRDRSLRLLKNNKPRKKSRVYRQSERNLGSFFYNFNLVNWYKLLEYRRRLWKNSGFKINYTDLLMFIVNSINRGQ
ncbi:hypothetical protein [Pseudoalteromonas sp. KAN5]|uniref:hypothetical protein n=1 Tax=Pseudoalteromonas sp. KAN5 TaxID=2916633 RepID=UPI001FCB6F9D|nr:hypothetical protein [Pseudoalteromonas sp. KAN5]BDF94661.1 hypothetical protein KAN5_14990 [Pseudoalteromonas sp. KAN5]